MNADDQEPEYQIPRTALEAARSSGDGRPPANTTVGLNDGDSDSENYRVGQKMKCLIINARNGGYDVLIIKDGKLAYLKTERQLAQGEVLLGEFRYWQDKD